MGITELLCCTSILSLYMSKLWFFQLPCMDVSWTIKKAEHQRIEAFELWCWRRLLRVLWTARRLKVVNPKGNQPWTFIGRTDAKAPILWPPDEKSWLIDKGPDAGKDWSQEEKGTTEDGMVVWHHQLNWREFEQAPGDEEGNRSLACCSPWGHKEWDRLINWTTTSETSNTVHQLACKIK